MKETKKRSEKYPIQLPGCRVAPTMVFYVIEIDFEEIEDVRARGGGGGIGQKLFKIIFYLFFKVENIFVSNDLSKMTLSSSLFSYFLLFFTRR